MRRGSIIPAIRALQPPPYYYDGIHLDFRYGAGALGCYVKAAGAAPTIAPLTTLFTFTGGNQSMYMGPAGLLVASVTNTPRIEFDANGNCIGLLIEASKTNLALHSADGTNAAWTKSNTSTAKTATGPDGAANSATTVTASAGNGTILQTVTSASAQRTFSIWLKRRTGTGNIDMTVDGGTGWTTKTITTSWARYSITQAAVTNPNFGLRLVTSGDEVDFYGAQLESAAFMTSTIPTTTVSVARTADSCIRTLGSEFSATAGTAYIHGVTGRSQDASNAQAAFEINDGTASNRIVLLRVANTDIARNSVFVSGAQQGPLDATFVNSAPFRSALAWAANDLALSFNGAAALTDTSASIPTMTKLELGCATVGNIQFNGHITQFDYYPTRLPNGFLTSA